MNDFDDNESDEDYSDESFYLDDDENDLIDCPSCGAEVYEDSPCCPTCGDYINADRNYVWANRPPWWVVLGVLGIIATTLAMTLYP